MEIAHFTILIQADKQKVWNTMLDDKTYREWTKVFQDGSYYEGSWSKNSEIRFMAPDDVGNLQGLFSKVKENIQFEFISLEHLGIITDGVVDTTSDEVKKWIPSFENYTFTQKDGSTLLKIDMKVQEEYKSMFEEIWPQALNVLKTLCEN
jgi:L-rhamnose mutarotase